MHRNANIAVTAFLLIASAASSLWGDAASLPVIQTGGQSYQVVNGVFTPNAIRRRDGDGSFQTPIIGQVAVPQGHRVSAGVYAMLCRQATDKLSGNQIDNLLEDAKLMAGWHCGTPFPMVVVHNGKMPHAARFSRDFKLLVGWL